MAARSDSGDSARVTIYAAFAANLLIAIAKFVAAGMTGSSSMLSEGFHSVVDSANQLLILFGEKRSKKPPDARHPLGYGREIYFWSFVVALLIFSTGAGLSFYEGIVHIRAPEPLTNPTVNYIVLAAAFLFEGVSWWLARRHFSRAKGDLGWLAGIRASKDPPDFIVLVEDSAALGGIVIAATGIFLAHEFAMPEIDGVASILIGALLSVVAILLARESHGLLIGERADPAINAQIKAFVEADRHVQCVLDLLSIHVAPSQIVIAMRVSFHSPRSPASVISALEAEIGRRWPDVGRIYITPVDIESRANVCAERADSSSVDAG
jgi:cation diffusion facilitator family transporter